jgi:hypothetical protein
LEKYHHFDTVSSFKQISNIKISKIYSWLSIHQTELYERTNLLEPHLDHSGIRGGMPGVGLGAIKLSKILCCPWQGCRGVRVVIKYDAEVGLQKCIVSANFDVD